MVPTIEKRCRQTGQGPKEGREDGQRAGEPALGGKTEGVKSFLPGERGLSGGLITAFTNFRVTEVTEVTKVTEAPSSQGTM